MTDVAFLSAGTGRAVVTTQDGQYALRVGDPSPRPCEETELANFLSLTRDATAVAADPFPFTAVARELEKRWRVARGLDYLVSATDRLLPATLRLESARRAEPFLQGDVEVAAVIRLVFFNANISGSAMPLVGAELADAANAATVADELRSAFALAWCRAGAVSRWQKVEPQRLHDELATSGLIFGRFVRAVRENRPFAELAEEISMQARHSAEGKAAVQKWLAAVEPSYRRDARYMAAVRRRAHSARVRAGDGSSVAHWAPFSTDTWPVVAMRRGDDGTWSVADSAADTGELYCFDALPFRADENTVYPVLALRSPGGFAFADVDEDGGPVRVTSREVGALHVLAWIAADDPSTETVSELFDEIEHLLARSDTAMRLRVSQRLQALLRLRPQLLAGRLVAKAFRLVSWRPFEARLTIVLAALGRRPFEKDDPKNAKTVAALQTAPALPLPRSLLDTLDRLVAAAETHAPLDPDDLASFIRRMWRVDTDVVPQVTRRTLIPFLDQATRFLADVADGPLDARQIVELLHATVTAHLMISRLKDGMDNDTLSSRLANTARAMTRADQLRFFEDRADRFDAGMLRELDVAAERIPLEPQELLERTKDDAKRADTADVVTSAGIVLRYAAGAHYDILNHASEALALLDRANAYFALAASMERVRDKWLYTHWARNEASRGRILARTDRNAAVAAFESAQTLAGDESIQRFDPYAYAIHRAEIAAIKLEHLGTHEQTLAETQTLVDDLRAFTRKQPEDPSAWNVLSSLYELRGEPSSALEVLGEWADTWIRIPTRARSAENVRYREAELAMRMAREDESILPLALRKYVVLLVQQPANLAATSDLLALLRNAGDEVKNEIAAFAAERLPPLQSHDCKTPHALIRIILLDEGAGLTSVQTMAQALAAFMNGPASLMDESRTRIIHHWTRFQAEALEYLTRELFAQARAAFGARSRDVRARLERIDALLDVCLSKIPRDAIWLTRKADIALTIGVADPMALARRLLAAAPDDAILRLKAAQLMIRANHLSEADSLLAERQAEDVHPAILDQRALLAMLRGDFELSSKLYEHLLAQNELDSAALWGSGRLAVERGDLEGAFRAWIRALRVRSLGKTPHDTYLRRRTATSLAALYRESGGSLPDVGTGVPSLYMRAVWEEPAPVARSLIEALGTAGLTDPVTRQGILDATGETPDSVVARQVAQYLMACTIDTALRPAADLDAIRSILELSIEWSQEKRVFGDFIAGAKRDYARRIVRHGWRGETPPGFDADAIRARLTSTELELLEHVASTAYSPDYYEHAYALSGRVRGASRTALNDFVLLLIFTVANRIRASLPSEAPLQHVTPALGIHLVSVERAPAPERLTVTADADALGELSRRFTIGPWLPNMDVIEAMIDRPPTLRESRAFANFGIYFREEHEAHRCYLSRLMVEAA